MSRYEPTDEDRRDYRMCDLDAAYADAGRGPLSEREHRSLLLLYPVLHRRHMEVQIAQMQKILEEADVWLRTCGRCGATDVDTELVITLRPRPRPVLLCEGCASDVRSGRGEA